MKKFLMKVFLGGVAVFFAVNILEGVTVSPWWYSIIVATVLSLLNSFVRPVLVFFTFPITIFSLGAFLLVINACLALFADWLLSGFNIDNFWWALGFSVIVSLLNYMFNKWIKADEKKKKKRDKKTRLYDVNDNEIDAY